MDNDAFRMYIGTLKGRKELGLKKGKIQIKNLRNYYNKTYFMFK